MKLFHLSDLHIGKRVNEFSMLEDQKYILMQILKAAKEHQPDGIILAGDIYDKPVPAAEAVQVFDDFLTSLNEMGLIVFMISGNHDSPERVSYGGRLMKKAVFTWRLCMREDRKGGIYRCIWKSVHPSASFCKTGL